jgi:hypothetical protein
MIESNEALYQRACQNQLKDNPLRKDEQFNLAGYSYGKHAPSNNPGDVINSGNSTNYVFSRGNGTVYIYNNTGVMATVPQKYFVTPK